MNNRLLITLLILGFMLFSNNFARLCIRVSNIPIYITELVLIVVISGLILKSLVRDKIKNYCIPLRKPFIFLCLIAFVGLIKGLSNYPTVYVLRQSAIVYYSAFYFLMPILFNNMKKINTLFKYGFITSIILTMAIVLNYFGFSSGIGGYGYLYLFFPAIIGFMYIPFLKDVENRRFLRTIIGLQVFLIMIFKVRGAWVAFVVALFFVICISITFKKDLKTIVLKKRIFTLMKYGSIGVIVLLLAIRIARPDIYTDLSKKISSMFMFSGGGTASAQNTKWRVVVWNDMLKEISQKPILGWGFGKPFHSKTIKEMKWGGHDEDWIDPHNSYLSILHRLGILGLGIFLFIAIKFYLRTLKFIKYICKDPKIKTYVTGLFLCYVYILTLSFFEVILEGPYMGSFLWITMGLIVSLKNIYRRNLTISYDKT